jgi:hypothetical protein
MKERIDKELALLQQQYEKLEYREDGQWVRIPAYPLPAGWSLQTADVVFQIPTAFPGAPPYGFYVLAGLQFNGQKPNSYTEPASTQPPFAGSWGLFSWSIEGYRPTAQPDLVRGYTLVAWAKGFANRFQEGK